MLFLRNFAGYSDKEILLRAQYITSEYCKAVDFDNAKSIVKNDAIVNYFELSCMLKGWR